MLPFHFNPVVLTQSARSARVEPTQRLYYRLFSRARVKDFAGGHHRFRASFRF
jgi:hypothetical protein